MFSQFTKEITLYIGQPMEIKLIKYKKCGQVNISFKLEIINYNIAIEFFMYTIDPMTKTC